MLAFCMHNFYTICFRYNLLAVSLASYRGIFVLYLLIMCLCVGI